MINKPLKSILKDDLDQLIVNQVVEGKAIEYKLEFPTNMENSKGPILAGISAFANTIGGDLIFGIGARNGIPENLVGFDNAVRDNEILRLESSIRSGIEPRLVNYTFHSVDIGENKFVLVLRINKSWIGPHMITYNGSNKFYGRSSVGKYPLDVSEIRRSILLSEMAPNRARSFREERVFKIAANDTYVKLPNFGKYIVHLIPQQSISSDYSLDIKTIIDQQNRPRPEGLDNSHFKINLDGMLLHQTSEADDNYAYLQWFRNGIIEYVFCNEPRNGIKYVFSVSFEEVIFKSIRNCLNQMKSIGLDVPVYIYLSMMGFKGYLMGAEDIRRGTYSQKTNDENILVQEKEIEDYSLDISKEMRSVFDVVWNAFGYKQSYNYNTEGNWAAFNRV